MKMLFSVFSIDGEHHGAVVNIDGEHAFLPCELVSSVLPLHSFLHYCMDHSCPKLFPKHVSIL